MTRTIGILLAIVAISFGGMAFSTLYNWNTWAGNTNTISYGLPLGWYGYVQTVEYLPFPPHWGPIPAPSHWISYAALFVDALFWFGVGSSISFLAIRLAKMLNLFEKTRKSVLGTITSITSLIGSILFLVFGVGLLIVGRSSLNLLIAQSYLSVSLRLIGSGTTVLTTTFFMIWKAKPRQTQTRVTATY